MILSAKGSAMMASQRLNALSRRQSNRPLQIRTKKNPSPMKEMGLLFQFEKSLRGLPPTNADQHSERTKSEEVLSG
jgi:hypothetical protein